MKTKTRNAIRAKRHTVNGQRMVTLSEEQYERLLQKADLWEPLLPEPLPDGNYPAREYMEASLRARSFVTAGGWDLLKWSWPGAPASGQKPSTVPRAANRRPA